MTTEPEVLFEIKGGIGLITLNRPKALNSLTQGMCNAIRAGLKDWERDPRVHAVVVVGAGEKAFCAGGDVVKVSTSYKEGTDDWRGFFHDEYLMNVAIDEFKKPYVSLVDGICMGGGVGVSIPGDFWVATEKTLFAMPETGLGLIPDVGGGWFLPRLPGEAGMYLALTGARLKAADLFALGIATHVVASADVPALVQALADADIHCGNCVKGVLAKFHKEPDPAPLAAHMDQIDEIFAGFSVEDIIAGLKADGGEWAVKEYDLLLTKSPTSMKVTFEQLRRGAAAETFREVMLMEYRIVTHILAGNDFHEGVRAILIDKDQKPVWSPATLADVSDKAVAAHFEPLGSAAELDLARLG
ncbi:enoyl-CoA hydratase/isomerase family protein [Gimibacter soli]|uniref:3-hydroxyisobutyryl-CoA hydrolase n=1 Tax=Gimibacter soli TaxID=3024400 RepID=A0AAE9XQ60_9PROT|nr:enoyl-CoA hydratase/isomerase family protein [Gimibacter soli]WCL55152.1 enoyl-CoA hydratase/isomerase family protein [Gimibacter soli]